MRKRRGGGGGGGGGVWRGGCGLRFDCFLPSYLCFLSKKFNCLCRKMISVLDKLHLQKHDDII
jgi:hypothetical protein